MEIIKRNGAKAQFDIEKIRVAIEKAFISVGRKSEAAAIEGLSRHVVDTLTKSFPKDHVVSVEEIQDIVELTLIDEKYHDVVRSFILYRAKQSLSRKIVQKFEKYIDDRNIIKIIKEVQESYDKTLYDLDHLFMKFETFVKSGMTDYEHLETIIKISSDSVCKEAPDWKYIASMFLRYKLELDINSQKLKYDIVNFKSKVKNLTKQNLYGSYITENYTDFEIEQLGKYIDNDRDKLLTYGALMTIIKNHLIKDSEFCPLETPQEMFMGIAMHLAIPEGQYKVEWAKKIYDMISTLKFTFSTPTMSNARKPYNQLSSSFIDTVPDTLEGIYRSIDNFARATKHGAGVGLYFGKVRASGSKIRGYKRASGGVSRWVRLANDTALAVEQLGVRQGSASVYLDIWHKDVPEFLKLKTGNEDCIKGVFPAVCVPDLFWRMAKEDIESNWYLMCPYQIKTVKGYCLEDSFGDDWEEKYHECVEDANIDKRIVSVKDMVRLIISSVTETGSPFIFNRDIVNRMNPNPHRGIIYSSNLCMEMMQNMSASETLSMKIDEDYGDPIVVNKVKAGDLATCNLASICLGNIDLNKYQELESVIDVAVRALDNAIDMNYYPLLYAKITNSSYRAIGLGTSGYHHALVKNGISWESEEHLEFANKLYERINYAVINASSDIAREKGSYRYFVGSDWHTGKYFKKRGYDTPEWVELKEKVRNDGLRNSYLVAVSPNGMSSVIAGTTAGVNPIISKAYMESYGSSKSPNVVPLYNSDTDELYKEAHEIDQHFLLKCASIRQRHIDQGQSLSLYITREFSFRSILNLYINACESGIKTLYHVKTKTIPEESEIVTIP